MRKCGLKFVMPAELQTAVKSLPLRKCGLKWRWKCTHKWDDESLPLRKCGLKSYETKLRLTETRHFPCGSVDWNLLYAKKWKLEWVTSLAEVWIEIKTWNWLTEHQHSHFPCGSVDWNRWSISIILQRIRHFPCGSVDWNIFDEIRKTGPFSHFPCGSVDWNRTAEHYAECRKVTSLAEVWIEIPALFFCFKMH